MRPNNTRNDTAMHAPSVMVTARFAVADSERSGTGPHVTRVNAAWAVARADCPIARRRIAGHNIPRGMSSSHLRAMTTASPSRAVTSRARRKRSASEVMTLCVSIRTDQSPRLNS